MLKALTGLGAAGAMLVTGMAPAMAAPVPRGTFDTAPAAVLGWNPGDESASQWRGGWRDRRWRGRNRGVDAGDILAGVLILGGIAAVASAATSNARRNGDDRSFNDDVRSASDQCGAAAVAQSGLGSRIERIDNVVRDGQGWRVEGLVGSRRNGVDSFTCGISFGRIDYVRFNRANGAWGANDGAFDNGVAVTDPPFSVDPNDDDYAWRNDDAESFPPE
ncbi:hypothetical protein C7451_102119 [Blastomonas natatoria]|uniref:Secreted protein n=1 Tax=Blastomonas natatoria TaxID=34015 RepID=A0A2V3VCF8_9SPHN|nr:hypothetical protein [Blastomonas natatoria]PXW78448.1 hypothetical protein C7451_102119 [Blastomonas natatoria]